MQCELPKCTSEGLLPKRTRLEVYAGLATGTATEKDRWDDLPLCGLRSYAPAAWRDGVRYSARHSPSARLQGKSALPRPRRRSARQTTVEAERVLRIGIDVQANELSSPMLRPVHKR